ncbi:unnamed protein product [Phaeothamnion confervicola]
MRMRSRASSNVTQDSWTSDMSGCEGDGDIEPVDHCPANDAAAATGSDVTDGVASPPPSKRRRDSSISSATPSLGPTPASPSAWPPEYGLTPLPGLSSVPVTTHSLLDMTELARGPTYLSQLLAAGGKDAEDADGAVSGVVTNNSSGSYKAMSSLDICMDGMAPMSIVEDGGGGYGSSGSGGGYGGDSSGGGGGGGGGCGGAFGSFSGYALPDGGAVHPMEMDGAFLSEPRLSSRQGKGGSRRTAPNGGRATTAASWQLPQGQRSAEQQGRDTAESHYGCDGCGELRGCGCRDCGDGAEAAMLWAVQNEQISALLEGGPRPLVAAPEAENAAERGAEAPARSSSSSSSSSGDGGDGGGRGDGGGGLRGKGTGGDGAGEGGGVDDCVRDDDDGERAGGGASAASPTGSAAIETDGGAALAAAGTQEASNWDGFDLMDGRDDTTSPPETAHKTAQSPSQSPQQPPRQQRLRQTPPPPESSAAASWARLLPSPVSSGGSSSLSMPASPVYQPLPPLPALPPLPQLPALPALPQLSLLPQAEPLREQSFGPSAAVLRAFLSSDMLGCNDDYDDNSCGSGGGGVGPGDKEDSVMVSPFSGGGTAVASAAVSAAALLGFDAAPPPLPMHAAEPTAASPATAECPTETDPASAAAATAAEAQDQERTADCDRGGGDDDGGGEGGEGGGGSSSGAAALWGGFDDDAGPRGWEEARWAFQPAMWQHFSFPCREEAAGIDRRSSVGAAGIKADERINGGRGCI